MIERKPKVYVVSPICWSELAVRYAEAGLVDSANRGEAPLSLNRHYGSFCDYVSGMGNGDGDVAVALEMSREWIPWCDVMAVYTDLGIDTHMMTEIAIAKNYDVVIEYRSTVEDSRGEET